jgi:hypothetical protein
MGLSGDTIALNLKSTFTIPAFNRNAANPLCSTKSRKNASSGLKCLGLLMPRSTSLCHHFLIAAAICLPVSGRADPLEEILIRSGVPSTPKSSLSSTLLLDRVPDGEMELSVFLTRRAANTRTPIHKHDSGGVTCVIQGESTLFVEGFEPLKVVAPNCYYMPSGVRMVGYNSGNTDSILYDIFKGKKGFSYWTVVESTAGDDLRHQFGHHH